MDEFNELRDLVSNQTLTNSDDCLKSCLSDDGELFVSSVRRLIDSYVTCPMLNGTIWTNLVPIKINCFIWRASIGRIPTSRALSRRGINFTDHACRLCEDEDKEEDHLFMHCPFAKEVLRRIWSWCGIPSPSLGSIREMIAFAANWGNCPKKRKVLLAITYGYAWCLWK